MSYQELGYESKNDLKNYTKKIFLWMALGLVVTAVVALVFYQTGLYINFLISFGMYGSLIMLGAQIVLVLFLVKNIANYQFSTLLAMFMGYSVLTGINLSLLPILYGIDTLGIAFVCASTLFISLAVIGYTTKADLSSMKTILFAGLISLFVATLVNSFLQLEALAAFLNYAGIVIFMGLTVYDMQKVKTIHASSQHDEELLNKLSIYCALELYLDFINLFIYIVRILGRKK